MTQMVNVIGRLDTQLAFHLFGDWTDRIAAGELPFAQPQRPSGIGRNVVLTLWDWSRPTAYLHDEISTDRRKPTINAVASSTGPPRRARISFQSWTRNATPRRK